MRRSRRSLSEEERRLWAEVARSIAPLAGRAVLPDPLSPAAEVVSPSPKKAGATARAAAVAAPEPLRKAAPPLAPLERRTARALARGRTRADGTLDLHGLTQAEAHVRLLGFLRRGQAAGHGVVLVITGRGREGQEGRQEGRGILRRMVPLWLGAPELRTLVLGFQEAGTRQGGAGALYVRLRRPRA